MIGGLATTGLLVILGIIFSRGKGSFLIAGYNTMPKKEKDKYDVISLCKYMAKLMYALAFCTLLIALSAALAVKALFYAGISLFFVAIVFALIYGNTGNRFMK